MPGVIRESPALVWAAAEEHGVRVEVAPREGLTLADYGTFTLTVRADPLWPRSGRARADLDTADPRADGWPIAASGAGTAGAEDAEVVIDVTVPGAAGLRRYVIDVVADGGSAGRVQIVDCTWLTVTPTLLATS